MAVRDDTIFALSSGKPPAGVAVIRLSGSRAMDAARQLAGSVGEARKAVLRSLRDPLSGEILDQGLVVTFPGPASFTGEDCAEIHVHGGRAVVSGILAALTRMEGLRPAEAGEFTRRAFEAGRVDLVEAEALADLIASETAAQRRQALANTKGGLSDMASAWRARLIEERARLEAHIDFVDEDDVPADVAEGVLETTTRLAGEMRTALSGARAAERIRDGFVVALAGPPNAGKSSLLNALARRDVAIVSPVPGTTRDVLEVHLDLGGYAVTVLDTAGLREASDAIEREGVRRARDRFSSADLVVWLHESGMPPPDDVVAEARGPVLAVRSKADLDAAGASERRDAEAPLPVSVADEGSVAALVDKLTEIVAMDGREASVVTNARQRHWIEDAARTLEGLSPETAPEILADALRRAGDSIGRLVGRIDIEDVLGAVFGRFCIGK